MTRTPHDQFSKQYLEELLAPLGQVTLGKEVPGEARQVDLFFSPATQTTVNHELLGLLGRFAATACLLEPFRNQPTPTEVRDCLLKLFLIHAELQRQARRSAERVQEDRLPKLWILASSASAALLSGFRAQIDQPNWGQGVYFLADSLRTAIVAINQLPATPETLWLRILGKGPVQQQAIQEVVALPRENMFRTRSLDLLFSWSISIESREDLDEEDRALIMQLSPLYTQRLAEKLEEGRQAGIQAGREEGTQVGREEGIQVGREEGIQAGREEGIQAGIQAGREEGIRAERRLTIETLLQARFGTDPELARVVNPILQLSVQEYSQLLLELPALSREQLLSRFAT